MKPRVLIFIVAYNADRTIRNVLSCIPESILKYDVEVLIIDDASQDRTFEQAEAHRREGLLPFKLTVLVNPVNQGYGGNQILGFQYAILHNFDVVALVHGDGQYAPESLPELLEPIVRGEADAVLGSRMMVRGEALKGGMPLYKYIGNKILTKVQNALLRASLTEFHSGYRIYSVAALKTIPFTLNTSEFHFDTEIIIQLLLAGKKIKEVSIPTYYGDEICHVNGLKYAWNVLRTTVMARMQEYGLLYQRRFDITPDGLNRSPYRSKLHFESSHTLALEHVPPASRVLDLGCGGGFIGAALKEKGCRVTGIDRFPTATDSELDQFLEMDLNANRLPVSLGEFDRVLMLDILEHLNEPDDFVLALCEAVQESLDTEIIVTTGNVSFFVVRGMLLLGSFNYGKRGILDHTHKRLFTFKSLRHLFEQRGFQILAMRGIPVPFPLIFGDNGFSRGLLRINWWLIRLSKGLFSYQIFTRIKPLPSIHLLLQEAHRASSERRKKIAGAPPAS